VAIKPFCRINTHLIALEHLEQSIAKDHVATTDAVNLRWLFFQMLTQDPSDSQDRQRQAIAVRGRVGDGIGFSSLKQYLDPAERILFAQRKSQ
jgi:hypothetical protein